MKRPRVTVSRAGITHAYASCTDSTADPWDAVPYIRNTQNASGAWSANKWKGCDPIRIEGRRRWGDPLLALAAHLEGVRIAGKLDLYLEGLSEPKPRSKKTRERKHGLRGVMDQLGPISSYESVRRVMETVHANVALHKCTPTLVTEKSAVANASGVEALSAHIRELQNKMAKIVHTTAEQTMDTAHTDPQRGVV